MTGPFNDGLALHVCRQLAAQFEGCAGLTDTRDIVEFAFDGKEGHLRDVFGCDRHHASLEGHLPDASRQPMLLENRLDGVEVVLGGQVEYRVVFIVESAMSVGVFVGAAHQIVVELAVRFGMPIGVHRHEACMLQESRIDQSADARMATRHTIDHIALEPAVWFFGGEVVDRSRAATGIDRPAHHGHRAGLLRVVQAGHHRDRSQHRHGRLAYRHQMHLRAEMTNELDGIADIVVQMERALREGHLPGVDPVGHIDIVMRQQRPDGVAQQRGMVARQGRKDQYGRVGRPARGRFRKLSGKVNQSAKGFVDLDLLEHRYRHAVDVGRIQPPFRLVVFLAQAVHQLESGCHPRGKRHIGIRAVRMAVELAKGLGPARQRVQHSSLSFSQVIEHAIYSD